MRPNRYPYSGRIKTPTSVLVREWKEQKLTAEQKKDSQNIELRIGNLSEIITSRLAQFGSATKTNMPDIERLASITEGLVTTFADVAISKSSSYKEAIDLVHQHASLTIHGQAIKKAIQDEIQGRALDSKIILQEA